MRNDILTNTSPIFSQHLGGGVKLHIFSLQHKTYFEVNGCYIIKGYDQTLGGYAFKSRFRYFEVQTTLNYPVFSFLTVKAGFDYSLLFSTNQKRSLRNYNRLDVGVAGGLNFFDSKQFGAYAQVVYGLLPMIRNYQPIDEFGNFGSKISDLKNTCIMVGVRYNIYDKKIGRKN